MSREKIETSIQKTTKIRKIGKKLFLFSLPVIVIGLVLLGSGMFDSIKNDTIIVAGYFIFLLGLGSAGMGGNIWAAAVGYVWGLHRKLETA